MQPPHLRPGPRARSASRRVSGLNPTRAEQSKPSEASRAKQAKQSKPSNTSRAKQAKQNKPSKASQAKQAERSEPSEASRAKRVERSKHPCPPPLPLPCVASAQREPTRQWPDPDASRAKRAKRRKPRMTFVRCFVFCAHHEHTHKRTSCVEKSRVRWHEVEAT